MSATRRSPKESLERALWESRLLVLVAVVASILLALATFVVATVDAVQLVGKSLTYFDSSLSYEARSELRIDVLTGALSTIDTYLIGCVVLVFSLGLYELFISKLGPAQNAENAESVLLIRTFDDLKDRLAKAVILVLVIVFFKQVFLLVIVSTTDLLVLALSVLAISAALYLISRGNH